MENTCNASPKPKNIREFLRSRNFLKPFIGILVGGLAGFLYYYFIGCTSGTCPITSNPYSTMFFGGFAGYMITSGPCTKC
jgi:hypothetical protein